MAELQKGLEGVIAAETKVSSIIDSQLTYAGYDIDDLAENAEFEEIIYLLWHYKLPNKQELKELKEKLHEYMPLNDSVYNHFKGIRCRSCSPDDCFKNFSILHRTLRFRC
ncbi:citrate synthase domain protein [Staphylococcus pettenkoferi VCU012]|nr:citrate synthase domain protein [Staphylococcus pettenkoferi VCU012]